MYRWILFLINPLCQFNNWRFTLLHGLSTARGDGRLFRLRIDPHSVAVRMNPLCGSQFPKPFQQLIDFPFRVRLEQIFKMVAAGELDGKNKQVGIFRAQG